MFTVSGRNDAGDDLVRHTAVIMTLVSPSCQTNKLMPYHQSQNNNALMTRPLRKSAMLRIVVHKFYNNLIQVTWEQLAMFWWYNL